MILIVNNERDRAEILSNWPNAQCDGNRLTIGAENDFKLCQWIKDHLDSYLLVKEDDGEGVLYETPDTIACAWAFQHVMDGDNFVQSFDLVVQRSAYDFGQTSVAFYTPWWLDLVENYLRPRVHEGEIWNRYQLECEIRTKCETLLSCDKSVVARYSH